MTSPFPAQPGTLLLKIDDMEDGTYTETPVVGWAPSKGGRVAPLSPQTPMAVQHGVAVYLPATPYDSALVNDPTYKVTFSSIGAWINFIQRKDPSEAPVEGEARTSGLGIVFNQNKSFVKSSFWHFRDGGNEFLFEVEGGDPLPDDPRVIKTNRRDAAQFRKTIPFVNVADLVDGEDQNVDCGIDEEAEDLI